MKDEITNLLSILSSATPEQIAEGCLWYTTAHTFAVELATKFDLSLIQAAGVISALSPQKRWDENQRIARSFCESGKSYHTACQTEKARACLTVNSKTRIAEILGGLKTRSFFHNIVSPNGSHKVTIDRWAIRACGWDKLTLTPKQYRYLSDCYRDATVKFNTLRGSCYLPCDIQAIAWVVLRGSAE